MKHNISTRGTRDHSGVRRNKNTRPTDTIYRGVDKRGTHTSPISYTLDNDGHANPARLRHAATKAQHKENRREF